MAWTNPGATPGTLVTAPITEVGIASAEANVFISGIDGATFQQLQNPILGIPFATTNPSGELTYTGSGGGPTRPSSGFLYPRGDS